MCDVVTRAVGSLPEPARREALAALAAAELGASATAADGPTDRPGPQGSIPPAADTTGAGMADEVPMVATEQGRSEEAAPGRTRLVTLGVAGGPVISNPDAAGVSTAVVYEDRIYVVDLGVGSISRLARLAQRSLPDPGAALGRLRGIFFTHLHSDHCVDWPGLYATGTMMANGSDGPVQVWGPGRRDTLPRVFPPHRPEPPVIEPDDPTPGIAGMTGYLRKAFAADFNDRARDSNFDAPDSWFEVHEIDHGPHWIVDPEGVPPRLSAPIGVWDDGPVQITATLVDHHPTAPAYGYRFDTPDGSIVVSGDTAVSENLIDLAAGADYLVHEVIDPAFADRLAATLPPEIGPAVRAHLLAAHTTIEQVGRDVAERAGVANLVLSHIVPVTTPSETLMGAQEGYSGRVIVGRDLLEIEL